MLWDFGLSLSSIQIFSLPIDYNPPQVWLVTASLSSFLPAGRNSFLFFSIFPLKEYLFFSLFFCFRDRLSPPSQAAPQVSVRRISDSGHFLLLPLQTGPCLVDPPSGFSR